MSREHKYRAWDKIDEKLRQVIGINFNTKEVTLLNEYTNESYIRSFEECALLEYTDLKDRIVRKDGSSSKEIYRCDVIKALNRNYDCEDNKENYFQLFEVTYLNGCYMFGNWNAHEFFNKFIYIEDLGSKFENPDLLKSK
jgi:hypothetical protein